ncbi:hypothetical protein AB1399_02970 [Hydrogenibacillus schlegelii]|uniref:Uncharacterized protein n=1 Tax=Hydrogenibacillus schlegelii TaxID=1484 RepID=A0A132NBU1_HYDSH|nr:hypothetical protein [Hydrogenibacillus schlegelii]KWX07500.1 hypothetical protein TR75_02820 [Hydrogenibacillus schlegelii]OAR04352.1 hypothetical protein SA87_10040 [Hydrogenibacillus schlegelii]
MVEAFAHALAFVGFFDDLAGGQKEIDAGGEEGIDGVEPLDGLLGVVVDVAHDLANEPAVFLFDMGLSFLR